MNTHHHENLQTRISVLGMGIKELDVGFKVITMMTTEIIVFWDVMICSLLEVC
jgi:hypothetical protein